MLQRPSSVYFPSLENKISIFEQGSAKFDKIATNNSQTDNAPASRSPSTNLSDPAKE